MSAISFTCYDLNLPCILAGTEHAQKLWQHGKISIPERCVTDICCVWRESYVTVYVLLTFVLKRIVGRKVTSVKNTSHPTLSVDVLISSPVKSQRVFSEVQQHSHAVSFLEQVMLAPKRVEESASRAQLLGCATGQPPGSTPYGTGLDADDSMGPGMG